MSEKNLADADGSGDPLTSGEVAVLSRVVRAKIIAEVDLVSSWGMGPWAAQALDGLLRRGLIRLPDISFSQEGLQGRPDLWIVPTEAGMSRMAEEQDVAFPPSGNWLTFAGLQLNDQPPDVLMQLIEYFLVRNGVMKADAEAGVRPARVLRRELLARLSETVWPVLLRAWPTSAAPPASRAASLALQAPCRSGT